ncbi:unnamed protein product [Penicillium viridicatum]
MHEPQWNNAHPPHIQGGVRLIRRPTPKVHLLSSYTDDICGLISPKAKDVFKLPVLSPNGHPEPFYRVIISNHVHEELEKTYMIKDDPVHEKRRHMVWFGIDLTDFGAIDTPERFFQLLETALASEKIVYGCRCMDISGIGTSQKKENGHSELEKGMRASLGSFGSEEICNL